MRREEGDSGVGAGILMYCAEKTGEKVRFYGNIETNKHKQRKKQH